jgi:hypothetical protein
LGERDAVAEVTLGVTGPALASGPELAPGVDAVVFVLVDDELPFVVRGGVTR